MKKKTLKEIGKSILHVLKWTIIAAVIFFTFILGYYIYEDYCFVKVQQQELVAENGVLIDTTRIILKNTSYLIRKNVELSLQYLELAERDVNIYEEITELNKDFIELLEQVNRGFKATNISFDLIDSTVKKINNKTNKLSYYVLKNAKEIFEKPSYDYLKSVTVVVYGEKSEQEVEEGKLKKSDSGWLGTGVVIKTEEKESTFCIPLEGHKCSKTITTYILTNKHVARGGKEVRLYIKEDNNYIEAEIIKLHDTLDLALIKVESKLSNKRPIKGMAIAYPQDKVYLVGHHLGREYIYGEGVFAGYDRIYDIIQIPTLYGNSGSGVFNQKGELVSLIFAVNRVGFFDVDCAHGIGISATNIKIFLQKVKLYE